VGVERLPAHAQLLHPDRRLARRHLRRAAHLLARDRRLRRRLSALFAGSDDGHPDRRTRPPGRRGALVTPASLAIIVAAFAPRERGRAIGAWTAWGAIGSIAGPLAGGVVVDRLSWRWIFALNLPLVAVTLGLVFAAVPASRRATQRRVDLVGAALGALALGGVVFALIEEPRHGWGSLVILVPLVAGVACFIAFLGHERRTPEPMLDLEMFTHRNFAVGNIETLSVYGGLTILFFFLTIYLQQVAGYTALQSGLTTLPVTLVMFALSRRFGALADRLGPRLFMGAGPLVAAAGILLLVRVGRDVSYVTDLLPALLLFALGLTATVSPLTATVLSDADDSDAGIASAINNAIARVAGLIGVSVIGVVVAGTLVGDTFAPNESSVRAFHRGDRRLCGARRRRRRSSARSGSSIPARTVAAAQCPAVSSSGRPNPPWRPTADDAEPEERRRGDHHRRLRGPSR
jgi:MFS family permease